MYIYIHVCVCACEKIKPDTNRWSTVRLCFQGCDARVSENRGPSYNTQNSRIIIIRTPK